MRHSGVGAFLALVLVSAGARATSAFGRETTSSVRGEITADDAAVRGDGVYGRFDGDLDLGFGAGASYQTAAERFDFSGRLSAHYFSVAGLYLEYSDALKDADPRRALSFGVDVRPLFVPRWATGRQTGPAFFDLTLDSISLGLGAFLGQPADEDFGDERGFEASLGLGLPLLSRAAGPWIELRGALGWPDGSDTRGRVLAVLSWHVLALTPLAPESE